MGGQDELVLTGDSGAGKVVIGGTVIADAPDTFLLSSTDSTNSVLVGNRASISFQDVITDEDNDFALWKDKTFELTVNDGTTITVSTDGLASDDDAQITDSVATADIASFTDIVTNLNKSIAYELSLITDEDDTAYGIDVDVVFTTGSNTLEFKVQNGVSNSDSILYLDESSTPSLVFEDVGFTDAEGNTAVEFTASGGETSPTETVRYVSQIDISSRDSALLAMTVVDAALQTVAANRGLLGAVANRLESTIQNLMTTSENTAASLSRIMDTDYAAESTRLAKAQVLQQASISILAQANATTQSVLKLLE
jgi:flagellin